MHQKILCRGPAGRYRVDEWNRGPPSGSASARWPRHAPTPSTWTSRNERRNTNVMAPRRTKKRSRSPSQKSRGDHAEDFDLPPSTEIPFSAPWHGASKDEFTMTAHLWPIELFEAFYGVLWKAVSKKDPLGRF
jgi:hypothetical protein